MSASQHPPSASNAPTLPEMKPRVGVIASRYERVLWAGRVACATSFAAWHGAVADVVVPLRMAQIQAVFVPSDVLAGRALLHLAAHVPVVVGDVDVWGVMRRGGHPFLALVDGDLGAALERAFRAKLAARAGA